MTDDPRSRLRLDRLRQAALLAAGAGLLACAAGWVLFPAQFYRSYLAGYLLWCGVALGCFALMMLHNLVGGRWGELIRSELESASRTLPLLAALFLPLLFGLRHLYVWARRDEVARDEHLRHIAPYLNEPFFLARAGAYFALWIAIAWLLERSSRPERLAVPAGERRLRLLSAPGLVIYGLTATFASIDWVMSLEPGWFSTVYGMYFICGQVLSALAFAALLVAALRPAPSDSSGAEVLNDLGNLILAFVMLWAYMGFSQFLLIWSGNLPQEIPWYLHRATGGWQWLALSLVVIHFALPFVLLLSRGTKRRASVLASVAGVILAMRLVDLLWLVSPAFSRTVAGLHWLDLAAPLFIGGAWTALFATMLRRRCGGLGVGAA